jgi:hypothetical protein
MQEHGARVEREAIAMQAGDQTRSRFEQRITRIHTLSEALALPLSREYLYSCDVRALPVLLEQLESLCCRNTWLARRRVDRALRAAGRLPQ